MTTSTQPSVQEIRFGRWIDDKGQPTVELFTYLERHGYIINKVNEAARTYTALDTGTATTAQIATALNTFMASIQET